MLTSVGDRIMVRARQAGGSRRTGRVVEIRGDDGGPPYLVRWDDDGHENLYFPGADTVVDHLSGATAHSVHLDIDADPTDRAEQERDLIADTAPTPLTLATRPEVPEADAVEQATAVPDADDRR